MVNLAELVIQFINQGLFAVFDSYVNLLPLT